MSQPRLGQVTCLWPSSKNSSRRWGDWAHSECTGQSAFPQPPASLFLPPQRKPRRTERRALHFVLVASGTASCLLPSAMWAGTRALSRCSGPTSWDQEASCKEFSTLWKHPWLLCQGWQGWEAQGALSQVTATQRFVPEWTVGWAKAGRVCGWKPSV